MKFKYLLMHILIVEDEAGIVDFLRQGLEEEAFKVTVATNGKTGLDLAIHESFDLIILDWMLPGISGIEICRRVRNHNTSTPIIFLTAKDTVDDTIFGLQSGANDYIKKPFHFTELLERIRVQLRPKAEKNFTYRIGDITLNPATHQVYRNDKEVKLTLKEFALLEYLLKNKGRICSRTKILEHVWDINFSYNSGVIDVFINALRKKLKLGKEEDYIQTVRGMGYVIREI